MLPNGCLPSGHKYASYGMCTICGEYEEWIELDRIEQEQGGRNDTILPIIYMYITWIYKKE